jgi:hypothetical protein
MAQLNMYTPIHKGLRNLLYTTALRAGATDWNDEAGLAGLAGQINLLLYTLRLHVRNEETYVHPLLADRLVGVHKTLEAAHREQEDLLDDLEAFLKNAQTTDPARRTQLGLECYRVLNRFIALYLPHLDDEEARVMLTINEAFTLDEILVVYYEILRNQSEHDLFDDLDMMLPVMTDDEVIELLQSGPAWMSPEMMEKAAQRAGDVLGSERWQRIMEHLRGPAPAHVRPSC